MQRHYLPTVLLLLLCGETALITFLSALAAPPLVYWSGLLLVGAVLTSFASEYVLAGVSEYAGQLGSFLVIFITAVSILLFTPGFFRFIFAENHPLVASTGYFLAYLLMVFALFIFWNLAVYLYVFAAALLAGLAQYCGAPVSAAALFLICFLAALVLFSEHDNWQKVCGSSRRAYSLPTGTIATLILVALALLYLSESATEWLCLYLPSPAMANKTVAANGQGTRPSLTKKTVAASRLEQPAPFSKNHGTRLVWKLKPNSSSSGASPLLPEQRLQRTLAQQRQRSRLLLRRQTISSAKNSPGKVTSRVPPWRDKPQQSTDTQRQHDPISRRNKNRRHSEPNSAGAAAAVPRLAQHSAPGKAKKRSPAYLPKYRLPQSQSPRFNRKGKQNKSAALPDRFLGGERQLADAGKIERDAIKRGYRDQQRSRYGAAPPVRNGNSQKSRLAPVSRKSARRVSSGNSDSQWPEMPRSKPRRPITRQSIPLLLDDADSLSKWKSRPQLPQRSSQLDKTKPTPVPNAANTASSPHLPKIPMLRKVSPVSKGIPAPLASGLAFLVRLLCLGAGLLVAIPCLFQLGKALLLWWRGTVTATVHRDSMEPLCGQASGIATVKVLRWRQQLVKVYLDWWSLLPKHCFPAEAMPTASEMCRHLCQYLPQVAGAVQQLTQLFLHARYSRYPISEQDVKTAKAVAKAILQQAPKIRQPSVLSR